MSGRSSIPGEGEYKQHGCGSEWPPLTKLYQADLATSPLLWIVAWNGFGAAVVLPLYCYCICLSGATKRDHTIPLNEARALIPTTIVGSFFPVLMFAPAILNWGTYHEHGYIAHYMWATAMGYIIVLVIASRPGATSKKDPQNPDVDSTYVSMSYMLAGAYAAAVHAVGHIILTEIGPG